MFITPSVSTKVFTQGKPYEVFMHPHSPRIANVIDDKGNLRTIHLDRFGQRCPHLLQPPVRKELTVGEYDRIAWRNAGHWSMVEETADKK